MQPRTVALVAGLSLAVGWFTSSIVSQNATKPAVAIATRGPRPIGRQEQNNLSTPQVRLQPLERSQSPSHGRNPFVFGPRRSAAPVANSRREAVTAQPAPVEATPVDAAPAIRFDLAGIASTRDGENVVFTAILNDSGRLVFVKAGDKLSNGFTVVRVEETALVLADAAGVEQRLRLK